MFLGDMMLARCHNLLLLLVWSSLFTVQAWADYAPVTDPKSLGPGREFLPEALTNAAVNERIGEMLPLELVFRNDRGEMIRLKELFDGNKPVVLSLNYSNCPMLCVMQLNGLINSLREIDLVAGRDFKIVSVSLDPAETVAQAAATKKRYIEAYEKPVEAAGWNFLVGTAASVEQLAEAVGIQYVYIPEKKEYSHPAVFAVSMPDGRISRYHYGIEFPPQTIRLSLVEASEGKVGTTMDRFLLLCFHYDAKAGSYAPNARNLMKAGGVAAILGLLSLFWVCNRVYHQRQQAEKVTHDIVPGA